MVELKKIDRTNLDAVIALAVREDQRELVASNVESIAQAYVQQACIPLTVCDGENPVGFRFDGREYGKERIMVLDW